MLISLPISFMILTGAYLAWQCDEPPDRIAALGQLVGGALIISGLVMLGHGLGGYVRL
jgi:hypothetical protein